MGAAVMIRKPKRAALYLRVSRDGQTTENQRLALEAVASQRGWTVTNVYEDNGISGRQGARSTAWPGRALNGRLAGTLGRGDGVGAGSPGPLLRNLMDTLQDLDAANVDLFLHQQAIDTTTPAGRVFFHILGAFSEFERDMIRSRVNAGLDRARAKGVRLGRPKVSTKVEGAIRKRLAAGDGMLKVAKTLGVGVSTVQRVKAEMPAARVW
jgi:DNA invertase Pin-like site-specific DNA recombinase